jgi:hypothetical protein
VRSNHWEYLAFVLFALGLALTISGSIIYVQYQQNPRTNPQYSGYPAPLVIAGICITTLGILAFRRVRTKKMTEAAESEHLPVPPPPPPLPPPP